MTPMLKRGSHSHHRSRARDVETRPSPAEKSRFSFRRLLHDMSTLVTFTEPAATSESVSNTVSISTNSSFDFTQPPRENRSVTTPQATKTVEATAAALGPRETSAPRSTPSSIKSNSSISSISDDSDRDQDLHAKNKRMSTLSVASSIWALAPFIVSSSNPGSTPLANLSVVSPGFSGGVKDLRVPMRTHSSACRISRVAQLAAAQAQTQNNQGPDGIAVSEWSQSLESQFDFDIPEPSFTSVDIPINVAPRHRDTIEFKRRRASAWLWKRQTPAIVEDPEELHENSDTTESTIPTESWEQMTPTKFKSADPKTLEPIGSLKSSKSFHLPKTQKEAKYAEPMKPMISISTKKPTRTRFIEALRDFFR